MAWSALTGQTGNGSGLTSLSVTTGAVSPGDNVSVAVTMDSGGAATGGSLTTTGATITWTRTKQVNDVTNRQLLEIWDGVVTAGGSTPVVKLQFTPTPGTTVGNVVSMNADPFSGSDTSSTTDGTSAGQVQAAPTTGTDALTSGSITTTVDGDLVYSATIDSGTGGNPGAVGTGYTAAQASGGLVILKSEWKTQTTHGAVAGTWTAAVNDAHITNAHAIKPASGGGGFTAVERRTFGSVGRVGSRRAA